MKDLMYIEELRLGYKDSSDELIQLIVKQPHSERYSKLIRSKGTDCEFAQIVAQHYSQMPIGDSVYFDFLDRKYKDKTCQEVFVILLEDREEPELVKLREMICPQKRK